MGHDRISGHHRHHHMHNILKPHVVKKLYMKALDTSPEDKRKEIESNLVKMIEDVGKKRAELMASKVKLTLSLRNPKSSEKEIQENFKALVSKKTEYMNISFEYLMKLRNIIGAEKFDELLRQKHRNEKEKKGEGERKEERGEYENREDIDLSQISDDGETSEEFTYEAF